MADIIEFAPRAAAVSAATEGFNMNPTPADFIDSEVAYLEALRLEMAEARSLDVGSLRAVMNAHGHNVQKVMSECGLTVIGAKSSERLAAEITNVYRHAIRQILYLAACAQIEDTPPGAA